MQTTRYPVQVDPALSGAIPEGDYSFVERGEACPSPERSGTTPVGGRAAPLDLIEGHLTDIASPGQYRRAEACGRLLENWFVPDDFNGVPEDQLSYVLKIQPFAPGGYEATCRAIDLGKVSRALEPHRRHGKREAPDEVNIDSVARASARARCKVRHLVRNMKADHLVTFTRAEGPGTKGWSEEEWADWGAFGRDAWELERGPFLTEEQWCADWDKLCRMLKRIIGPFPYVAILERHRKGNFHLHVAWCGKVNVKVLRKCWLAVCGTGCSGNIDAKWIKAPHGHDRASRIARYISKYVSKSFQDNPRFNKKRYWASRQTLEEARRYVLKSQDFSDAVREVKAFLGLNFMKFVHPGPRGVGIMRDFFPFPDSGGFWINYLPDLHGGDPPF